MKITALEEYGLRCMIQLATAEPGQPITVAYVAEREGLSPEYAGKLLNLLGQAQLVSSVRGRNGGFVLTKTADEISLAEIVGALADGLFDAQYCQRYSGIEDNCVHLSSCSLRPVWWTLSQMIQRTLERVSLIDLMQTERQVRRGLRTHLETTEATIDIARPSSLSDGAPRLHELQISDER